MSDPWAFGWSQVFTIIGFAITIVIAVGGFRSFGRWQREQIEEKRIDTAVDALVLIREAKWVFDNIRSPMSFDYEWKDMPKTEGEDDALRRTKGSYFAILKRVQFHREFFRPRIQASDQMRRLIRSKRGRCASATTKGAT
jgi:hypothetical protein